MSDDSKNPGSTPGNASPAGPTAPQGKADADAVPTQGMTFTNHLFIWALVILVGVVFGIGGYAGMMFESRAGKADIEVLRRKRIADNLEAILNPQGASYDRMFGHGEIVLNRGKLMQEMSQSGIPSELYGRYAQMLIERQADRYLFRQDMMAAYSRDIMQVRMADARGLMPHGGVLDAAVKRFLSRTGPGGRTFAQIIADHNGGPRQLSQDDIALYVRETEALEALSVREGDGVALPASAAAILVREEVAVDEVALSAKVLLPEVLAKIGDDDADLQKAYTQNQRKFSIPASATLAVFYADARALTTAAEANVPAADIAKYYEDRKYDPMFRAPPASAGSATSPAAPSTAPMSLAEATPRIRTILAGDIARSKGRALVEAFAQKTEKLDPKDAAGYLAAAKEIGLGVRDPVVVAQNANAKATMPLGDGLGEISDVIGIFSYDAPFVFEPIESTGVGATWLVVRSVARTPASTKPLSDPGVRAEIKAQLATVRAHAVLLERAEALRKDLEERGPGALAAAMSASSASAAAWQARVTRATYDAQQELSAPGSQYGQPGVRILVASLTGEQRPVAIVMSDFGNDGESIVRLIQVAQVTAKPGNPAASLRAIQQSITAFQSRRTQKQLEPEKP